MQVCNVALCSLVESNDVSEAVTAPSSDDTTQHTTIQSFSYHRSENVKSDKNNVRVAVLSADVRTWIFRLRSKVGSIFRAETTAQSHIQSCLLIEPLYVVNILGLLLGG